MCCNFWYFLRSFRWPDQFLSFLPMNSIGDTDMEASYGDCQLVRRSKQTFFMDLLTRRCTKSTIQQQVCCDTVDGLEILRYGKIYANIPWFTTGLIYIPGDCWISEPSTLGREGADNTNLGSWYQIITMYMLCDFWDRFQSWGKNSIDVDTTLGTNIPSQLAFLSLWFSRVKLSLRGGGESNGRDLDAANWSYQWCSSCTCNFAKNLFKWTYV